MITLYQSNKVMNSVVDSQFNERLSGSVRMLELYIKEQFGDLSLTDEGALVDAEGVVIDSRFDYIDALSEGLGVKATIFSKQDASYTRVLTSITDDKGKRAVGTVLDPEGKAYQELNNGNQYIGQAEILGKSYVTIYKPILSKNNEVIGVYFVGVPNQNITSIIRAGFESMIKVALLGLLVILVVASFASYFLGGYIVNPIIAITKVMKNLGQLDFRFDPQDRAIKFIKRKDEIGIMIRSVKEMRDSVADFIHKTISSAEQLATTSDQLSATSQQSSRSAEEVAQTINEIARGASDQAESTSQGADKLMVLGHIIEEDKENIRYLGEASLSVTTSILEGLEIVKDLEINTKANGDAAGIVYDSILKTNESSSKISAASSIIASIAGQTNLLALNAAIEAARAGEQGKGFAVVADEIRKLAEQSTQSTKNIDLMVTQLMDDSKRAVQKMQEAGQIVKNQEISVDHTRDKFKDITHAMEKVGQMVKLIEKSSHIMDEQKQQVNDVIQTLSAVAEENAASTEQASAAIDEQSASIDEISSASENLSELAMSLRRLIEGFKV